MKRSGNIFDKIMDFNNLRLAYLKALKGKRFSPNALLFDINADENLLKIRKQLELEKYKFGNYRQFKIYDPKERVITAASSEDRIVHHAIMNVLEEVFEKQFIFHTYACRKEKGMHKAIEYAWLKARKCKCFLKLDVRKYFDSVNHSKLKQLLERIIKDKKCLKLLSSIIDSFETGLPIGNLTSQFFANFYLSPLDHFVLEQARVNGYVRYMDDIVVFSDSRERLKNVYLEMKKFIDTFYLTFKQPVINSCKNGIPFLGHLIKAENCGLLNRTRKRRLKRMLFINHKFKCGIISLGALVRSLSNLEV